MGRSSGREGQLKVKKKKILFFLEALDHGGLEKVTLDLANHLNPEKYDITVMQRFKGGYYRSQLKPHIRRKCCFPLFANGVARCFGFLSARTLHRIFIRGKYDVEIGDGEGYPSKIISGSPNRKSLKISWVHMDVVADGIHLKEFDTPEGLRNFYGPFDHIVCVSEGSRKSFQKRFGFEEKLRVLYNPIPEKEILSMAREPLDYPLAPDVFKFVSLGRLEAQKAYDRLLRVHKRLIDDGLYHHVYVLGKGSQKKQLEEEIRKNGLENSFFLLGNQENPYCFLAAMDCLVSATPHESFGIARVESLLLGIPVLTTNVCATQEIFGDSEYGLVVENDEQAIYDGMKRMLCEPKLVQHYREKAQERGKDFRMEPLVREWEKLLDEEKHSAY